MTVIRARLFSDSSVAAASAPGALSAAFRKSSRRSLLIWDPGTSRQVGYLPEGSVTTRTKLIKPSKYSQSRVKCLRFFWINAAEGHEAVTAPQGNNPGYQAIGFNTEITRQACLNEHLLEQALIQRSDKENLLERGSKAGTSYTLPEQQLRHPSCSCKASLSSELLQNPGECCEGQAENPAKQPKYVQGVQGGRRARCHERQGLAALRVS